MAQSWFGGRFSQISNLTDQLSTFTKEVLTETTEEVEGRLYMVHHSYLHSLLPYTDPSAELQIARKRISELEAVSEHTKTEVHYRQSILPSDN